MDLSRDRSTLEREYWRFQFPASQVREAAETKLIHHQHQLGWWTDQLEQAEEALRTKGVEFREHQGTRIAGHGRIEASLDPGFSKRVAECQDGVERHQRTVEEMEAYVFALIAVPDEHVLDLTVSDVRFFALGKS